MKRLVNYLQQVKTKKKISTAISLVVGVFLAAVLMALIGLLVINSKTIYFYHNPYVNSTLQLDIRRDIQSSSKYLLWAISAEDEQKKTERMEKAEERGQEVVDGIEKLKLKFDNKALLAELEASVENLGIVREQLVQLEEKNASEEALALYDGDYTTEAEGLEDILERVGEEADRNAEEAYRGSIVTACVVIGLLIIFTIFSILVGIVMTRKITQIIVEPVEELEGVAKQIAKGDLNLEVRYQGTDEFGELADAFRVTCDTLKKIMGDLQYLMGEVKNGNFLAQSQCREAYIGDYENILNNITDMVQYQSNVLYQIHMASEQVNMGASQLAESAQTLAEGATEQAGAVEELTATIENVTAVTEQAADATTEAYHQAGIYIERAEKGNEEMRGLIRAMEKIDETSRKIEGIIGEIEDIASQTNLLSLNASIEAARAGEAGRGFAVVADQIGKLASDSAASAVTTRELLTQCLEDVQNGNEATGRTREVIGEVIEGIQKLAEVSKNTSEAASSQVSTMKEVESGIEQISGVVQSNSATAQETSATSEELSAQASSLNELISRFRLLEDADIR